MQKIPFSLSCLAVILFFIYAVPVLAEPNTISWSDLSSGEDSGFDDPFEKLTSEQLTNLGTIARIRWLIANRKSSPDGVSAAEEKRLVTRLSRQGVDVDRLLSLREKVTKMRRKKMETGGEDVAGQTIRIPGYMIPVTFDQTRVTGFLLVPWVPPCSHFPPPPPNQVIHVSMAAGTASHGRLDPIWVEGKLHRKPAIYKPFLVDGSKRIGASYTLDGITVSGYSAKESGAFNQIAMPTQDSVHSWFMNVQMQVASLFTRAMTAIRDRQSSAALWIGLLIAFAYGALHTLGPGHGKAVVISYFVGHGGSFGRGVRMGAQIAICHVLSAVVVVWLTSFIIHQATGHAPSDFRLVKLVSYAAITVIGAYLLWQAIREALPKPAGHSHEHGSCPVEGHAEHHNCCACSSHSAHHSGPIGWLALAVGAVPCTGAILVLLFGLSHDLLCPAILMVIAISLGMAMAMSGIGILAILGRNYADRKFNKSNSFRVRFSSSIRVAASALITIIGLSLFSVTMITDWSMPPIDSTEINWDSN